ncbi:hypothetical protein MsAg5_16060 [Methanosarcinaceae archaeon Ag5]|uniref:Uncharacterized protein n=1 Tax=Methanolapillus africanus TaxID=3028297 RepID=A0AAE4MKW3_9EURY|nr:hypothetical protein [Methanosarcinaceae archaeon Ag5]
MNLKMKSNQKLISIGVLFAILLLTAPVFAQENGSNLSASDNSSESNVFDRIPVTNPNLLNELFLENDTGMLDDAFKISGEIPQTKSGEETYDWGMQLFNVSKDLDPVSLEYHLYGNGGPFYFQRVKGEGYIEIGIDVNNSTDAELDQIILLYEEAGKKNNVSNVPLVFLDYPIITLAIAYGVNQDPAAFNKLQKDPNTLRISGTVPKSFDREKMDAHYYYVGLHDVIKEVKRNEFPERDATGFQRFDHEYERDHVVVYVNTAYNVTDAELDEIVRVYTVRGESYNVSNLPVVIIRSGFPIPSEIAKEAEAQKNIDNYPGTDPEKFENLKSNEHTVRISGTVPSIAAGRESYEWHQQLEFVETVVRTFGLNYSDYRVRDRMAADYRVVGVDENGLDVIDVDKYFIDVYTQIGRKNGIDNYPIVVFDDMWYSPDPDPYEYLNETPDNRDTILGLALVALIIVGFAVYIWYDGRKKE